MTDIDGTTATGSTPVRGLDEIPGGDVSASLLDPGGARTGIVGPRTGATA